MSKYIDLTFNFYYLMTEKNLEPPISQNSNQTFSKSSNRSEPSPYSMFYNNKNIPDQINKNLNNDMHFNQSFNPSNTSNQNMNIQNQYHPPTSTKVNPNNPPISPQVTQASTIFNKMDFSNQNPQNLVENTSPFSSHLLPNDQKLVLGVDHKLRMKFNQLSVYDPKINTPKEAMKINICKFTSSILNIGFFVLIIFKFKQAYLESLTKNQKIKLGFQTLFLLMIINTPFNIYVRFQTEKSFNKLFSGMTEQEIEQRIKELDKKIIKII